MRKRSFLLAAGACLATLSLTVGSAMAEPTGPPTPRDLNGTGSDTTQGVLNALSNVVKIGTNKEIGSWDAVGSPTITTKPTPPSSCTINRPSGSNNGINALVSDRTAATHCLSFARSSTDNHSSHSGNNLTYIPFATDAVTYAIQGPGGSPNPGGSSINKNLPVSVLLKIYQCDPAFASLHPLLPQFGSGTRKFFLENILHVPSGDVANYASPQPGALFPCVNDQDGTGKPLLENTGNLLTDESQLEPYSVSSWIAQTTNNVPDVHGVTLLGNIGGIPSLAINSTATGVRPVFNVVPDVLVQAPTSNSNKVFVGPNSLVCQNAATILKQGFLPVQNCGDTSIRTPNDVTPDPDTVGPGE